MYSAKLILILAVASAMAWECGVTPEWESRQLAEFDHARRLQSFSQLKRSTALGPIRINPFYVKIDEMSSESLSRLKTIMPSVLKWYSKVLSVHNVEQTFFISAGICGSNVPVPAAHQQTGVSGTDVVLYVVATKDPSSSAVAYATSCAIDISARGNPIVGMLNINIEQYSRLTNATIETDILRHEIAHVLAFSSKLFPLFKKPDGSLINTPTINSTARGHSVVQLATPKVVEKARAAFGCNTLIGLELENEGGAETIGSHWEKRLMFGDFMMGNNTASPVFSDITLAIFEDSGWYSVDYAYAEQIIFGKDQGCDFFNKQCVVGGVPQFSEFCAVASIDTCDMTATFKSSCTLVTYNSNLPAPYQYFSNPKVGGFDQLMDYCPINFPFLNGDCTGKFTATPSLRIDYGEKVCENCRCFTGTQILGSVGIDLNHSSCLEVACENGVAYVILASKRYACPTTGGKIVNLSGFTGYINCPKYEVLCKTRPCPHGCSGNGLCIGTCKCNDGYWDAACSSICHGSCRSCSAATDSSCTSCKSSIAVLSGGKCTCPTGYYMSADWAQCLMCPANCISCVGAELCATCKDGFYLSADKKSCIACDLRCITCSGAGTCTKCKAVAAVLSAGKCNCPSGYYMNSDYSDCVMCDVSCKSCTTDGLCSSCKASNANLNSWKCSCPNGFYMKSDYSLCMKCDTPCKTCTAPGSCISCNAPTAVQYSGNCICPDGYYMNGNSSQCLACDASCKTCTASGLCGSCKAANAALSAGKCSCSSGFYMKSDYSQCIGCDALCKTCTSPIWCTSCKAPNAILKDELCTCANGYYMSTAYSLCVACDASCKTCTLPVWCTSCKASTANLYLGVCSCSDGYYMKSDYSQCAKCESACKTCTAAGSCSSCKAPTAFLDYGKCTCSNGFYMKSDNTQCLACDTECSTCTATGLCASCKASNAILSAGKCTCAKGYYMSPYYYICSKCDESCQTCKSSELCTSCKTSNAFLIDGKCKCGNGFYMENDYSQCKKCDASCKMCLGPFACTACVSANAILISGQCVCPNGYFPAAGGSCSPCYSSCQTCTSASSKQCTSCYYPKVLRAGSCTTRFLETMDAHFFSEYDMAVIGVAALGWMLALILLFSRQKVEEEAMSLATEEGVWAQWRHSHLLVGLAAGDDSMPRACKPIILTATLVTEFSFFTGSWLAVAVCLGIGTVVSSTLTILFSVKGFRIVSLLLAAMITAVGVLQSFQGETQWEGLAAICAGELLIGQSLIAFERVLLRKLGN